jgi:predicted MFS family arabinose efflux permease
MPEQPTRGGFPRPFESSYAASLSVAIQALVPFILITTAFGLYRRQIAPDIGADPTGLEVIMAIATAGYAFGAMLGGDIIQRFPQRRLFFACEGLFLVGAIVAASAPDTEAFGIGQALMGFATDSLLVVALPPVVLWITEAFTVMGVAIYLLGTGGLPQPDLEGWLKGDGSAFRSPQLGETVRN